MQSEGEKCILGQQLSGTDWTPSSSLNTGWDGLPLMPFSATPTELGLIVCVFRRQALTTLGVGKLPGSIYGFGFLTPLPIIATYFAPVSALNFCRERFPYMSFGTSPAEFRFVVQVFVG